MKFLSCRRIELWDKWISKAIILYMLMKLIRLKVRRWIHWNSQLRNNKLRKSSLKLHLQCSEYYLNLCLISGNCLRRSKSGLKIINYWAFFRDFFNTWHYDWFEYYSTSFCHLSESIVIRLVNDRQVRSLLQSISRREHTVSSKIFRSSTIYFKELNSCN